MNATEHELASSAKHNFIWDIFYNILPLATHYFLQFEFLTNTFSTETTSKKK